MVNVSTVTKSLRLLSRRHIWLTFPVNSIRGYRWHFRCDTGVFSCCHSVEQSGHGQ